MWALNLPKLDFLEAAMLENDKSQTFQLHATIHGRVQGVGFRAFVEQTAHSLGLTGWVRNRWDSAVETAAEGPRPALEQFLAALYRGPRSSNVSDVDFDWQPATGEFKDFRVRMTE
jgi:acylphosphatase